MSLYDECNCEEREYSYAICEKHFWAALLHKEDVDLPACITQSAHLRMVFDITTQ